MQQATLENRESTQREKPIFISEKVFPSKIRTAYKFKEEYLIHIFLSGVILFVLYALVLFSFSVNFAMGAIIGLGLLLLYSSITFFVLQPTKETIRDNFIVRNYAYTITKTIEKPVQVIKEKILEKPTIKYIERPVYIEKVVEKPVVRTITKRIYIQKTRKKLNIPKYAYVGSTQTRRYHKRTCRLGKLIKRKYKLNSNSQKFYKKKHFKSCKSCLKR
jgi:hypothetical protein